MARDLGSDHYDSGGTGAIAVLVVTVIVSNRKIELEDIMSTQSQRMAAKSKMLATDAFTDILDRALDAAEDELRKFIPAFTSEEIADAFTQHVETHLAEEMANIADHGTKDDE